MIYLIVDVKRHEKKHPYNSQDKKIDVIVLDHHQSDIKLPNACAIVNPNRYDDKSGLNYLCYLHLMVL